RGGDPTLAIARVDAVRHDDAEVHEAAKKAVEALHERHRARLASARATSLLPSPNLLGPMTEKRRANGEGAVDRSLRGKRRRSSRWLLGELLVHVREGRAFLQEIVGLLDLLVDRLLELVKRQRSDHLAAVDVEGRRPGRAERVAQLLIGEHLLLHLRIVPILLE